jgi:hypothetical protein
MIVRSVFKTSLALILLSWVVSCKDQENNHEKNNHIMGKWDVYATEINNKQSRNMDQAFFEFYENGTVYSNIFADSNAYTYTLNADKLSIQSPEPMHLMIKNLTRDSMQLEGNLRVFYMRFFLTKDHDL